MKKSVLIYAVLAVAPVLVGFYMSYQNYHAHPGEVPPLMRWIFEAPLIVGSLIGFCFGLVTFCYLIGAIRRLKWKCLKSPVFWLCSLTMLPTGFTLWVISDIAFMILND